MSNYFKISINDNFEEECKKLKIDLEKKGYRNVSWTELIAVLLEKNRKLMLSDRELENVMKKMRGLI